MESARITVANMISYEEKFRREYPDCRVIEEILSDNFTWFHVVIGNIHCSYSGIRDMAFKYALDDIREGKLRIPPCVEQFELFRF